MELVPGQEIIFLWKSNDQNEKKNKNQFLIKQVKPIFHQSASQLSNLWITKLEKWLSTEFW